MVLLTHKSWVKDSIKYNSFAIQGPSYSLVTSNSLESFAPGKNNTVIPSLSALYSLVQL